MSIKTTDDWWELARDTVPRLKSYAWKHGVEFDDIEADEYISSGAADALHAQLESLWRVLPDDMSIRHAPFFALCDLCSEYWVFDLDV